MKLSKILGVAAAVVLGGASAASAATVYWTFTSTGANGSFAYVPASGHGSFTEFAGAITSFTGSITTPDGTDTALSLNVNPNGTAQYTTPSGLWNIDNAYPVTTNGIWASGSLHSEYNLWANSGPAAAYYHGSGSLGAATNGRYDYVDSGVLTLSATPEPASWALMLVGIGGLGASLRARRKAVLSA